MPINSKQKSLKAAARPRSIFFALQVFKVCWHFGQQLLLFVKEPCRTLLNNKFSYLDPTIKLAPTSISQATTINYVIEF
jgi:hypothetical protein